MVDYLANGNIRRQIPGLGIGLQHLSGQQLANGDIDMGRVPTFDRILGSTCQTLQQLV